MGYFSGRPPLKPQYQRFYLAVLSENHGRDSLRTRNGRSSRHSRFDTAIARTRPELNRSVVHMSESGKCRTALRASYAPLGESLRGARLGFDLCTSGRPSGQSNGQALPRLGRHTADCISLGTSRLLKSSSDCRDFQRSRSAGVGSLIHLDHGAAC